MCSNFDIYIYLSFFLLQTPVNIWYLILASRILVAKYEIVSVICAMRSKEQRVVIGKYKYK